jgi:Ca2+-binding EF-hand superfamily protein/uncharacterized protein YcfJ
MSRNYKTGLIITGDASGGIRAIKATDDELGKLNQGFDRGTRRSKQFTQNINGTSRELQMLRRAAAPIAGAIAGMFAANSLQNQINWGDQLQKTNLRIGASTEALSQYNYVASLSGVEFNQLTTAWQRQTRRIAEAAAGTGVAVAALDRLNLSAQELNQLAPEDQFERIAEAMQGVENSSERVRLAQQLWDSEGVKLVQIVNSGTDAIAAMRAEADALGLTISQDTANAMASYNDEVDRLKFAAQGVSQTLLSELVPAMTAGLQNVNAFIQEAGGAEVVVGHLTDGAQVLAVLLAGRYAGAFATATAAKLAATQQSIAYQMALARMAGVSATAAGAQASLAAATRGAGAAMALVGGPLGAAMIAGGAIYYFREELGLVAPKVQTATERVDDMTSALDANSEAALKNARAMLEAEQQFQQFRQTQLAMEVSRQRQIVADEQRQWDAIGGHSAFGAGPSSESQQALQDLQVQLMDTRNAIEAAGGSVAEIDSKLEALESTTRDVITPTTDLGDATNTTAAAAREAAKQTTTLANSYENLLDRIQPNRRAARQYAQDVGTLNLALATGRINAVQYMQAMGMLQESFQAAQRETEQLADATERAAFTMEGAWDEVRLNGLRRLDDGIANMWQGAIDGSLDAGEAMKRIFSQTLAEMAHMAITRPIMVQIAGSMGMGGSGPMSGGLGQLFGGQGGGLNLGSLGNIGSTISGWFGGGAAAGAAPIGYASGFGAQAATGTYTGWAGSAAAGAANPGMLASMGGFSGIASGLGAGYMGYQLGQSLAPDAKYGEVAGGLGALGGFALGGPIGAAIGGAIVPAISKGLFGGSWQTKDAGLQLGVSSGDFVGNQYERQRKSGGLFSGSSYRTQTSALDAELEASLSQTYEAQELALRASLETLGQQSDALNSFSAGLQKISTKGKSEAEIEQAVQEWLQGIVNRAAQSVVDPSDFALAGETTVDTLNRLATALTGVNPIMEQLHGNAFAASLAGGDAAASLVALSGGMDLFTQRADYYYQNFYSETERQQAAMDQAAQAMGAFTAQTGKIVTSADQLRELVDGIDRNTQSGRELYAAAMQLAPALVEVENGLERVRGRFTDMLSEAENALSSAEQQARSAYAAFEKQSFDQQLQLLGLLGNEQTALALQRERELQGIDPLLQETQRRIWAMEDEAAAQQAATQAGQEYARSLAQVNDQLSSTFNGISQWVDQQSATAGTPGMNLTEAGDQFARQLVLAQSGDRNALQSITQYAEQYLAAGEAMYASGGAFQRIQGDVLDALKDLPDQIAAEEYLAQEIRDALQSVVISSMPTDERLAVELSRELTRLDANQLTAAQVRSALAPHATDAEISRLIREVDANGDGIITKQELANQRLAGLASGIGSTLKPMFDSIDLDASGLIDWNEFYGAFQGLASDEELRRIFGKLDEDGSGTISRLEALNRSSQGTEGNTQSLEERAREQLGELTGLVGEMTRSTDQFVGLNTTMVSLRESINALGVAQEEVARIERERLAAEKAERDRLERERVEAQRESLASEIDRLQREQQSLANTGVSAPSRSVINSSYRHVPDAINHINRTVGNILGSSGVTDRSVERLRDYYTQGPGFTADQGVGDAPGAGGAYSPGGMYWPYVEAYLREIENAIDTRQSATSLDSEIARLRAELNKLNSVDGSHATGLWNVPFDGYIAELHRDEMVVPAQTAGRLRELPSRELPMPALPNFPLLNRTDQHDVVRDLLNENKTLRKELTALLKRIEQHGAAGVAVQQEAAKQQISELKKSNLALDDMSAAARLEALR